MHATITWSPPDRSNSITPEPLVRSLWLRRASDAARECVQVTRVLDAARGLAKPADEFRWRPPEGGRFC